MLDVPCGDFNWQKESWEIDSLPVRCFQSYLFSPLLHNFSALYLALISSIFSLSLLCPHVALSLLQPQFSLAALSFHPLACALSVSYCF